VDRDEFHKDIELQTVIDIVQDGEAALDLKYISYIEISTTES